MNRASFNNKNVVNSVGISMMVLLLIEMLRNDMGWIVFPDNILEMNNVACTYSWDEQYFLHTVPMGCLMHAPENPCFLVHCIKQSNCTVTKFDATSRY